VTRTRIVIIGAGDHGRGTLEILLAAQAERADLGIEGFLDDDPARHGSSVGGFPVLGGLEWASSRRSQEDLRYVIGIAACRAKREIVERLLPLGPQFTNAIHPSAVLGRGVVIAPGTIINAGVVIAYDTIVGPHTTINLNATVGHDCRIGAFTTIGPGANVAGRVTLGNGCNIGLNAAIGKGLALGAWSVIGPGAVVMRDVPPDARMFGNPARAVPRGAAGHSTSRT